jgi:hypothetical protein
MLHLLIAPIFPIAFCQSLNAKAGGHFSLENSCFQLLLLLLAMCKRIERNSCGETGFCFVEQKGRKPLCCCGACV